MPLFEQVSYHIAPSIAAHQRMEIARILDANGAIEVALDRATHVVSDTIEFESCDTLTKGVSCISPRWVERSMELGQLQNPKYFSANKALIFSGVVATSADLPLGDKEVIAAGIQENGGQWREGLTRDVTHLFVTNTHSEKYQTVMHFRDSVHITVLLPHWFDQCWTMQTRLPTHVFEFPDPPFLKKDHDHAMYKAQMVVKKEVTGSPRLDTKTDQRMVFRALSLADNPSSPAAPAAVPAPARDIWQGRTLLLSSSLGLDVDRRESVESRIRRAGGNVVVAEDDDEGAAVAKADVLVTRFRTGAAYTRALEKGKLIGTLAWLFYVDRSGIVSQPRDQLLHYPVRNRPINGFEGHEITVTNYQGDARDYLKKLIDIMGAKFTPTMSGKNTIVIAAYKSGNKTAKADEWSVPIVTHKWLEDCFVEWRNLTPAQPKYVDYAPGINYGTVLGERGVGNIGLEEDPELPPVVKAPHEKSDNAVEKKSEEDKPVSSKPPESRAVTATTSTREAREVAEVEDALYLGAEVEDDMPVDDAQDTPAIFTPTKVGPPRGIKKSVTKNGRPPSTPTPQPQTGPVKDDESEEPPPTENPVPKRLILISKRVWSDKDAEKESPRGQAKPQPLARSREDNAVESAPKVPVVAKPKPKPKPRPSGGEKGVPTLDSEEESGEEEGPTVVVKGKAAPSRKTTTIPVVDDDDGEDVPRAQSKVAAKKQKAREITPIDVGVDETPPRAVSRPSPRIYKSKAKTQARPTVSSSQSDLGSGPIVLKKGPPKKGPPAGKASGAVAGDKSKAPPQRMVPSSKRIISVDLPDARSLLMSQSAKATALSSGSGGETEDEVQEIPPKKSTDAGKVQGKSTSKPLISLPPKRVVSVDLSNRRSLVMSSPAKPRPCLHDENTPEPGRTDARGKVPQRLPPRTASSRAMAYEAPSGASPKRGRPSLRNDTTSRSPTPSPRRSPRRPPGPATSKASTMRVVARASTASSPPPLQRTPSRRSAAAAATQKLRNEIVPDMNDFQNEQRRDAHTAVRKRKSSQYKAMNGEGRDGDDDENEDSEGDARGKKRRKLGTNHDAANGKSKGKTQIKAARKYETDASDTSSGQFVIHVKNDKRAATTDDDDEPGPGNRTQAGSRKKARMATSASEKDSGDEASPNRSSCDPKTIRVLTTKITVTENVKKAFEKMGGARFTSKPAECTHLVASSFARTENFLCALSNAPFVLNEDWLTACAKWKKVVAETGYALKDNVTERKHGFKMAEALVRARRLKENKKKVLQGHFFYVTKNVPLNFELLRNVVQTNGAECMKSAPTMRNISPTRHVISCPKDEKIWQPLANHGVPIYSHELVLMAALAQFVDWDDETKRVPGSL